MTDETMRSKVLEEAKKCVCQDRNVQYGNPEDNFQVIANYWNAFLEQKTLPLQADDVAILMTLFKIGRTTTGGFKEDNYIDMAGYVACAAECAEQRAKREKEAKTECGETIAIHHDDGSVTIKEVYPEPAFVKCLGSFANFDDFKRIIGAADIDSVRNCVYVVYDNLGNSKLLCKVLGRNPLDLVYEKIGFCPISENSITIDNVTYTHVY